MNHRFAGISLIGLVAIGCSVSATARRPGNAAPANNLPREAARSAQQPTSKTICRSEGLPRDWVIVDYTNSADCAQKVSGKKYNAMLITDASQRAVGATMLMCSGQPRPSGWDETSGTPAPGTQCPREPGEGSGQNVVEIIRNRPH